MCDYRSGTVTAVPLFIPRVRVWCLGTATLGRILCFRLKLIFSFCRQSSTDMPFGFVKIKNTIYIFGQSCVDMWKPFTKIFMYCRFRDAEFFGCFSDCGMMPDCIIGNRKNSFFNIRFHGESPVDFVQSMLVKSVL